MTSLNQILGFILLLPFASCSQSTSKEYFKRGGEHYDKHNTDSALYYFTKAIELSPNFDSAYFYRGCTYSYGAQDYNSAIADFSKTVSHNQNFTDAYFERAVAYGKLSDYTNALADCNAAIAQNDTSGNYYYFRGAVKAMLLDNTGSCADIKKAVTLGNKEAEAHVDDACK